MDVKPFLCLGPTAGGSGGDQFNDVVAAGKTITGIQQIKIRADRYVDAIEVSYYLEDGNVWTAPQHGRDGGEETTIKFAPGETIYQISGTNGIYIDSIMFNTILPDGKLKVYGPYGGKGDQTYTMYGAIVGFLGRATKFVDAIGVYNIVYPVS